jgi:hypothetical protein
MAESTLIKFPSNLPAPLLSDHSLKQQSNLLRTKMDSGHSRVRRRFKSVSTVNKASWLLKNAEAAAFEGFIEHALYGASAWFLMDVLTPLGMVEHEVRFITSPMEDYKALNALWWQYSAQIEIKQRAIISEEQTAESLLNPNTTTQFTDGVKDAVNSYQE